MEALWPLAGLPQLVSDQDSSCRSRAVGGDVRWGDPGTPQMPGGSAVRASAARTTNSLGGCRRACSGIACSPAASLAIVKALQPVDRC